MVSMNQQLNAQSIDVKLWCKTDWNPIKFCCQSKKIILKRQTFALFKFKIQLNVGLSLYTLCIINLQHLGFLSIPRLATFNIVKSEQCEFENFKSSLQILLFNSRNEIKLKILMAYVKEKYLQKGNNV